MNKKFAIAIAVALIGITLELVVIYLLLQKRLTTGVAIPMIVTGMFLAFVPMFVVARRARRR